MHRPTALICLAALAGPALADVSADTGAEIYAARCAACHGPQAHGDGPMAPLITIPVPDLSRLAGRNGGTFPRAEVARIIDGRQTLRGHGGTAPMPVFGPILGGGDVLLEVPGEMMETRGDVMSLTLWLESIQEPVQ